VQVRKWHTKSVQGIIGVDAEEGTMSSQPRSRWKGLTVVATVSGMLRAQFLKAKLEEAGIQAILDYETAGLLFGIAADGLRLAQVRVLVADRFAEEARHMLTTPPPQGWETDIETPPNHD
jgi:hypothetical protein